MERSEAEQMREAMLKFLGNPVLETERLILRKLDIPDAQDVFEYAKNPEVTKYMTWETHKSVEDSKGYIHWALERYERMKPANGGLN